MREAILPAQTERQLLQNASSDYEHGVAGRGPGSLDWKYSHTTSKALSSEWPDGFHALSAFLVLLRISSAFARLDLVLIRNGEVSARISCCTSRILDYSKVNVKPVLLQYVGVPEIGHYEAIRKELVRLLRKERERRRLSNYAVSKRSGVSESMLSLVERDLRNPTVELLLRIADGIGTNLPALVVKATATVVRKQKAKSLPRKGRSAAGADV